jgi:hypothetical protein
MMEARMFHSSSPNRLYQDYQGRAEAAVLRRARKREAQPWPRRGSPSWQMFRRWLAGFRVQVARTIQPSEQNGYIA